MAGRTPSLHDTFLVTNQLLLPSYKTKASELPDLPFLAKKRKNFKHGDPIAGRDPPLPKLVTQKLPGLRPKLSELTWLGLSHRTRSITIARLSRTSFIDRENPIVIFVALDHLRIVQFQRLLRQHLANCIPILILLFASLNYVFLNGIISVRVRRFPAYLDVGLVDIQDFQTFRLSRCHCQKKIDIG